MKFFDVVIIGAGAAGMMAALEIALTGKSVAIIEAKNRTGGRMHTINNPAFEKPVELGAEFVHGDLPITLNVFEQAGIKINESKGDVWEYKEDRLKQQNDTRKDYDDLEEKFKMLTRDVTVAHFMNRYLGGSNNEKRRFALKNYVQGYCAGDIEKASSFALCEELTSGEEEAYRVDGGYQKLVKYLEEQCRKGGVIFYLSEEAQQIKWQAWDVKVITNKQTITGKKALVTVSIGVLQSEAISFSPALPQKMAAAKQLGFGHVVKINLQFTSAFWQEEAFTKEKNLSKLNFLFSEQAIPTWWTQHPKKEALLVGWLGGPPAEEYKRAAKEVVVENAITSLAKILGVPPALLQQKLKSAEWYNWSGDEHFCGAYSYNVVDGEALIKTVLEPVDHTIYFAGEGLHSGNEIGTVEAALTSGRNISHQLIAHF